MPADIVSESQLLQPTHQEGEPQLPQAADLPKALKKRLSGEVRFDTGSRALYATDLSIYRQPPIGAVIPRTIEDVMITVDECRQRGIRFSAAGVEPALPAKRAMSQS